MNRRNSCAIWLFLPWMVVVSSNVTGLRCKGQDPENGSLRKCEQTGYLTAELQYEGQGMGLGWCDSKNLDDLPPCYDALSDMAFTFNASHARERQVQEWTRNGLQDVDRRALQVSPYHVGDTVPGCAGSSMPLYGGGCNK